MSTGPAERPSPEALYNLHPSVRATYDSRKTGPRYWVTTEIGNRTIAFRERLADPFVRTTVHVGWRDLLRGLLRLRLVVTVTVGGDRHVVNDVLELDDNTLIQGRTRKAAFRQSINDTTEEEIDRQMAEGEPMEVVGPAQTFATSDPTKRTWPPSGYLCLARGNIDCPGHPSKWMTCPSAGTETGDADG